MEDNALMDWDKPFSVIAPADGPEKLAKRMLMNAKTTPARMAECAWICLGFTSAVVLSVRNDLIPILWRKRCFCLSRIYW